MTKRDIPFSVGVAFGFLALIPARCAAPAAVRVASVPVMVDGRLVGAALVQGGTAYLPLKTVAKYLRLKVAYNADAQMIIVTTPAEKTGPGKGGGEVQ